MINTLKHEIRNGKTSIGTFISHVSPDLVEIIALGGFDFIVIDREHGHLSIESTKNLLRAAELRGMSTVVRVTKNSTTDILQALDVGSQGVQVPQINTVEDAKKAINAAKYFPDGNRGLALTRSADYGNVDAFEYFKSANQETLISIHCENIEGFNNLDEILKLPEIDVVFLGPFDMSQSLGIPGQVNHPKLEEISLEVVRLAKKYNKAAGIFVANADEANRRIAQGFRYVTVSVIESFILSACKNELSKIIK